MTHPVPSKFDSSNTSFDNSPPSPPSHAFSSLSIDPSDGHSRTPSSSATPTSSALASRSTSATSTNHSGSRTASRLGLRKRLSGSFEIPRKLKESIPEIGEFLATMTGLPVIRDAIDGVQAMQDMSTSKQKLIDFGLRLQRLLDAINSKPHEPKYMIPAFIDFKSHLENMYAQVQQEIQLQPHSMSALVSAERLINLIDSYENKLATLVEEAMITGIFAQQNIPDEFDSTIPILKLISKDNGLLLQRVTSTVRYDGTPVDDSPLEDHLHVSTCRGTYKGNEVEVRSYFGGSEEHLIKTVRELAEHHEALESTPHVQELHGGAVTRGANGRLRAHLVFSPLEGEPWLEAVKAQQSVKLLCQIAEETAEAFKYLKIHKQVNWESIRVRPDGTLVVVPSTEGDRFLRDEDVLDPSNLRDENFSWPLKQLCQLLHESSKQGILLDATAALRAHDGPWTKVDVWKIARNIGLRPPEESTSFKHYPPEKWTIDPGWIIRWPDVPAEQWRDRHFEHVTKLPPIAMTEWERRHQTSFMFTFAVAQRGDEKISYRIQPGETHDGNWLLPTDDGEWECLPLEPWEGVDSITLNFESARLDMVGWREWRRILDSASQRKKLKLDELAITVRTECSIKIYKRDVPELGTRPLYFYRKPNQRAALPHEFWGFYTFNKDPLGPTGLTVRYSGPENWGRIVSESLPPVDYIPKSYDMDCEVFYVNMSADWDILIESELAQERYNQGKLLFDDSDVEWPDKDDRMDVD